ncbi:unnamed protein product [Gadus morhua 'NCC']
MSLMYLHRSSLMSGADPPALRPILDSSGVPRAAPRTAGEQMGADSPAGSHGAAHPIIPGPPERLPSRGNPQAASSLVAAVTGDATSLAGGALVICSSDCVLFSGDGAGTGSSGEEGGDSSMGPLCPPLGPPWGPPCAPPWAPLCPPPVPPPLGPPLWPLWAVGRTRAGPGPGLAGGTQCEGYGPVSSKRFAHRLLWDGANRPEAAPRKPGAWATPAPVPARPLTLSGLDHQTPSGPDPRLGVRPLTGSGGPGRTPAHTGLVGGGP